MPKVETTFAMHRRLFANRPFRNLMLATLTSAMGDWIGFLAIIALTAEILGPTRAAAFAVSGVMVARVLPSLLLGPVAGMLVDRWDRKRVMIWAHLGRGAVMALIPFTDEVLTLVLATLLIEVLSSLFAPAKDSVLPTLVRDRQLVAANQLNLLTTYGTLPLGAALYSVLLLAASALAPEGTFVAERPLALPIWFNACTFWLSAPLVASLTFSRASARKAYDPELTAGPWTELKEGFRFVGTQPVIRAFILGVMVAAAAAGVVITTGEFFANLLNAGSYGYGILVAIVGVGLVGGLLCAQAVTRRVAPERLFAPGVVIAGTALIVTALMPTLLATVPSALVMGAGAGVCFIVGYTVLQQRADDRIRGRTFGAFNSGIRLAIFGSAVAVPAVIGVVGRETRAPMELEDGTVALVYPYVLGGVRLTLIAGGILAVVGGLLVGRSLSKALHREERGPAGLVLGAAPETRPAGRHGLFVVFEGGDGAGKSTHLRLLRSAVERVGHLAVVTREPGGTRLGEQLRALLLAPGDAPDPRAEALLYAAARSQHVRDVIEPGLERGAVVLCDRFVDSSVTYQGAGRGLGEEEIAELNRWAIGGTEPDLVILLDVDPEEGLRRAAGEEAPDRFESEGLAFHREVREAFLRRADADPARYLVIDAGRPVEETHAEVRDRVLALLGVGEVPTAGSDGEGDGGAMGLAEERRTAGADRPEAGA